MKKSTTLAILALTTTAILSCRAIPNQNAATTNNCGSQGCSACACQNTAQAETLPANQGAQLSQALQNELLQHYDDELMSTRLYLELGKKYPARPFVNIPRSEKTHRNAFEKILAHHSITSPTPRRDGFLYAHTAEKYQKMLTQGLQSRQVAFQTAANNEKADIASLQTLINNAKKENATQIIATVTAIQNASHRHLAAFTRHLNR